MISMEKFNHIEIQRENEVRAYRFRSNPTAPRPPIRDRQEHGIKLLSEFNDATKIIEVQRRGVGIEADKLLILNIYQNAMSPKLLDNMLRKFNLSLVEEVNVIDGSIRLMIQFPDANAIDRFNYERRLWEIDDNDDNILTYAERRDAFSCIESIRNVSREDRIGQRLKIYLEGQDAREIEEIIIDIDVWHNGENFYDAENLIRKTLGNIGGRLLGDFFTTPSLLLGRVKVNQYGLNALLDLDVISCIDLPMGIVSEEISELLSEQFEPIIDNQLDENAPLATILDSGIFTAHPLLADIIVAEEDFDGIEQATNDINGHGTAVAGIVAYGDFNISINSKMFKPLVRLINGKVMHNEQFNGINNPVFRNDKRPEVIIKDAIEYFHNTYGCRVFNLSAGSLHHIYNGGRQMAWAEILDSLARSLDIVIVISAGNVGEPYIDEIESREDLNGKVRDNLFQLEHRLIDPATASLCITVGSISRCDEPETVINRSLRIAAGPQFSPSAFTRIGKGVNKAIKPELVDFGGNYAVHQIQRNRNRWHKTDRNLSEITLNNTHDKMFKCYCGTSFSAPRVTHLAARIEKEIQNQLGQPASANLIRALLVNSASINDRLKEWTESSVDPLYNGRANPKQERRLRLIGYGQASEKILNSTTNQVTLLAEDKLSLRSFHLYKIPVPTEFLKMRSNKRIAISLAYNPPSRLGRKEYLANNIWFEVYRRIDEELLSKYKAKIEDGLEVELPQELDRFKADFSPGCTEVDTSTVQQRVWNKGRRGGEDLLWDDEDPYIWILVVGKEKFKHPEQELPQEYAIVVTFSYDCYEDIQLYSKIKTKIRNKVRQPIRTRIQMRTRE
jgi:hypothetical protein